MSETNDTKREKTRAELEKLQKELEQLVNDTREKKAGAKPADQATIDDLAVRIEELKHVSD
jgi:hypothetical protein